MLQDGQPSVVFTASRETLTALRHLPWVRPPAWISGETAGIGATRVPPASVLALFQPGSGTQLRHPTVLLATDVAAEGLNLQRVTRLVHFDLPWTPMRIEQREGRAVRLGQLSDCVTVLRWHPWPLLEERLRQQERLLEKRRRIERAGLTHESEWLFRWRSRYESHPRETPVMAVAEGHPGGWLVGVAIDHLVHGIVSPSPADLVWFGEDGTESDDPQLCVNLLGGLAAMRPCPLEEIELPRDRIAEWIRTRLRTAESSRWSSAGVDSSQRQLIRRLQAMARAAGQRRHRQDIELAERAATMFRGGLTAGEAQLLPELLALEPDELRLRLARLTLPPHRRVLGVPRLIAAVRIILPP
jgi:hypothetical protein